jgi:hypothetical protein
MAPVKLTIMNEHLNKYAPLTPRERVTLEAKAKALGEAATKCSNALRDATEEVSALLVSGVDLLPEWAAQAAQKVAPSSSYVHPNDPLEGLLSDSESTIEEVDVAAAAITNALANLVHARARLDRAYKAIQKRRYALAKKKLIADRKRNT